MKVYLTRFDLQDGDPSTFYAVPVIEDSIRGELYRREPEVREFIRTKMPSYRFRDINDGLQVYTIRNNKRDKKIEIGDVLYIAGHLIGEVERVIEAP